MDIGRVVPLMWHSFTHRHMPTQTNLQPIAPITKIRKTHNRLLGNMGQIAQNGLRVAHGLNGLAQHNHVKTVATKCRQSCFNIRLNHIHATLNGCLNTVGGNFHTVTRTIFMSGQSRQQLAITTTQIQHMTAVGNPVVN